MQNLSARQNELIQLPIHSIVFLEGVAGTGKTTAAVGRLLTLIQQGIPAQQIFILVPQRTLAQPYREVINDPDLPPGGAVTILTIGGLARRLVELFWPEIAESAGFHHPEVPPTFLTLETAQYFMAKLVRPLLEKGYFASLSLDPNRLYSQILDNLNKAAIIGIPYTEIGGRLKSAWNGSPGQLRVYDDVQECASLFRQFCFEHNLLDFSLQIDLFLTHLLPNPLVRAALNQQYRHLIADNIEEDIPITHEFIRQWLPHLESALLIYDLGGGYRVFLGADPTSAYSLKDRCSQKIQFDASFIHDDPQRNLLEMMNCSLNDIPPPSPTSELRTRLQIISERFYPQMLDLVTKRISTLINDEGIPPQEIVVLAPYLNDSLRFSLTNRLERAGISVRSHRPSRALREEAVIRTMLNLAVLAHPQWLERVPLNKADLAATFFLTLDGLDLIRAQLLANSVYFEQNKKGKLAPFEKIAPSIQERITYRIGEKYEQLRTWITEYASQPEQELELFFIRIFDEILTTPGFRFYQNERAGELVANLVESVQKFRWSIPPSLPLGAVESGLEYIQMLQEGVIAAQYLRSWEREASEAVFLAPAYTFLLANRAVDVQIWLDIGSSGWYERLFQPLTHPYVLSRNWENGKVWTAEDEQRVSQQNLSRIVLGLLRRCRRMVWIGFSELGESGFEQRGLLLRAIQRTLEIINQEQSNG